MFSVVFESVQLNYFLNETFLGKHHMQIVFLADIHTAHGD